jgi:hypothetical protein
MVQPMGFDPGGIGRAIEVTDTFQTREAVAHMTRSLGAWELSGLGARYRAYGALDNIYRHVLKSRLVMPRCALCEHRLTVLWGGRRIQALLIDTCLGTLYVEGVCAACIPHLARYGHALPLARMSRDELDRHLLQLAVDARDFGWTLPSDPSEAPRR